MTFSVPIALIALVHKLYITPGEEGVLDAPAPFPLDKARLLRLLTSFEAADVLSPRQLHQRSSLPGALLSSTGFLEIAFAARDNTGCHPQPINHPAVGLLCALSLIQREAQSSFQRLLSEAGVIWAVFCLFIRVKLVPRSRAGRGMLHSG